MSTTRFQRAGRTREQRPEKFVVSFGEHPAVDSDADSDSSNDCGVDVLEAQAESIEMDEEIRLHVEGMGSHFTKLIETNWASKTKDLPSRSMPPGNIRMLHLQYQHQQGVANDEKGHVSYALFWKTFRQNWHQQLRFLPGSTHGSCDTCSHYKEQFAKCHDPQARFELIRSYKKHLDEVFADRSLEEFLQSQRPLSQERAALCLTWESWWIIGKQV